MRIWRSPLACLWMFLFLSPVLADEPFVAPFEAHKTVRVGVWDNPPIVTLHKNAAPEGIAIDVIREIAAQESWQLKYVPGAWDEVLKLLDAGKIDLLVSIAHSEERTQRYRFNRESLLGNWGVVYRHADAKINSLIDIKGQPVALMRSGFHSTVFVRLMKDFGLGFTPVYTDTYAQVLEAVERGEAKAGVVNRTFSALHAHRHGNAVETGIVFNPIYIHYAAPKNSDPALLQTLDRHLAAFKADPRSIYHDSLRRWLETRQVERFPPWVLWAAVAAAGLLALAVLLAVLLRHQVSRRTSELRHEIEQRRLAQERLKHIAYHDRLTRLPNREGFNAALANALKVVKGQSQRLALLFIDIDRLKNVNDGLGHAAGDLLLQSVAERLQASLQPP